jgi:hypothetical protein
MTAMTKIFIYFPILGANTDFAGNLMQNVLRGVVPILVLVVVVTIALKIAEKKRMDKVRQNSQNMIDADDASNYARHRDIGKEFFYTPGLSNLPLAQYSDDDMKKPVPPYMWQAKVVAAAEKQMLRFDRQYSNVELKQMFGPANLDNVAKYEENFSNFIHAMRYWAEALINSGRLSEAQKVLEQSVKAGSELSQSYTLLADIYKGSDNITGLKKLLAIVEKSSMPGKNIAIKHIGALLKEAGA